MPEKAALTDRGKARSAERTGLAVWGSLDWMLAPFLLVWPL